MCDNLDFDNCDVSTDVDFEDLSDSSFDTTNDLITDDVSDDSFDLSDDFEMEDISDDSLDMTDNFEMEDISDESFDVSDDLVMEDISDDSLDATDDLDIEDISDESFDVDTSFETSDFIDDFDNNNFDIDDVSDDSTNDYFDEVEFDSEDVGEDDVEALEFGDDFSTEIEDFDISEEDLGEDIGTLELNDELSDELEGIKFDDSIEALELDESSVDENFDETNASELDNDFSDDEFLETLDEPSYEDLMESYNDGFLEEPVLSGELSEENLEETFNVTESVDNTDSEIDDLDTENLFEENEVNDDEFAEFEGAEEQLDEGAYSNEYTEIENDISSDMPHNDMSEDEMINTEENIGYPINEIETTEEFNINDIEQALTNHEVYDAPLTTEEYSDDSALEEVSEHEIPSMTDEELDAFVNWENEHNNGYYDIINDIMNDDSLTDEQKDAMITPLQEELNSLENETVEYGARVKGLTYDGRDIITSSPDEEYGNELPLDENLNIDLEGNLTEEELNSVYEGLESFDFQGVNALEDTERLDENLENFTNENWENLSIEEQKESMNDLAQYIIDVTGLENPPKIEFYNNDKEGDYGGFDRLNNTLSINEHMLYQNDEAADTVAHELWHALQYQRASNPQTRQDLMYAENFSNYISPSEDFEAYQSQILESEARAFAQQIKDRLASYSK